MLWLDIPVGVTETLMPPPPFASDLGNTWPRIVQLAPAASVTVPLQPLETWLMVLSIVYEKLAVTLALDELVKTTSAVGSEAQKMSPRLHGAVWYQTAP